MESVKLVGNSMVVSEEDKRRIIDLHFNQGKTIREVCRILGKSSHDITPVTKEHRIQLAQDYALVDGEQSEVVEREQDRVIPNVKAYNLFDEGKSPLEVAASYVFYPCEYCGEKFQLVRPDDSLLQVVHTNFSIQKPKD